MKNIKKEAQELFEKHCSALDSSDFGSGVQYWMNELDLLNALQEFISKMPYNPLLNIDINIDTNRPMNHDNFTEVTSDQAPSVGFKSHKISWASGYNTCLSRTNAAELLDSLIKLTTDDHIEPEVWNRVIQEAKERIKKATDEK